MCFDLFEQEAFEITTVTRTVCVNAAGAAIQGSARLVQARGAKVGLGRGNCEAKQLKARDVVLGLELDIGKDHSVTAEAAREAERLRDWRLWLSRSVQEPQK